MRIELSDNVFVNIDIYYKDVKNFLLKIYPDGNVKLNVPLNASEKSIRIFLESKNSWLDKHIKNFNKYISAKPQIWHLGSSYEPKIEKSTIDDIEILEDEIIIRYKPTSSPFNSFDKWWRKNAKMQFSYFIESWMVKLNDKIITKPNFSVRRMKSLWGSCTPIKNAIRLNFYLLCAPTICIDYIVLHEMSHLFYPNHGNRFHAFLTYNMPDWKDRKKLLNTYPFIRNTQDIENQLKRLSSN